MSTLLMLAAVLGLALGQHSTHTHTPHGHTSASVSPTTGSAEIPTLAPVVVDDSTTTPLVTDTTEAAVDNETLTTESPVDTTSPDSVTTDSGPTDSTPDTDTPSPVTDTPSPVTDTPSPVTDTTPVSTTPTVPQCQPRLSNIAAVYNYTNENGFQNLSENQQILIYELLAASENCALKDFINAQTAQRIFLVTEDLPLRQVYTFISFLARSLEAEGIVVPV